MKSARTFMSVLALVALAAGSAQADDVVARQLFNKAVDLYKHRADSAQVSKDILDTLNKAEAEVRDSELRYDILVLTSRTKYWQGMHADNDDARKVFFLDGQQKADAAILVSQDYSEAYFFAGINLARWAEANGIVASISHKGELIDYMNKAADVVRTTRDGGEGALVDGNGPNRVLGRMYEKLPGILGGDHGLAVQLLRKSVQNAPKNALNVLYLAASLLKGNRDDKAEGKKVLETLVAQDPTVFGLDYDRVPETVEEFALAKDMLAGHTLP